MALTLDAVGFEKILSKMLAMQESLVVDPVL
jgi:hypothetical protein